MRILGALAIAASFSLPVSTLATSQAVEPFARFEGRPAFKEGSDRSYFVWRDGRTWHVRWTTMGSERTFTGTVRAGGGDITGLKRIDVDEELKVIRPGKPARIVRGPGGRVRGVAPGRAPIVAGKSEDHITRVDEHLIRWTTRTDDDIDGFDFTVDGVRSLTFDLNIQGESKVSSVEIGRGNVHPNGNPFTVRVP